MPVTDDLRAIAERMERELDSVHDFFQNSNIVWLSFKIHADQGHKISVEENSGSWQLFLADTAVPALRLSRLSAPSD